MAMPDCHAICGSRLQAWWLQLRIHVRTAPHCLPPLDARLSCVSGCRCSAMVHDEDE